MRIPRLAVSILLTGYCLVTAPLALAGPQCQGVFENTAQNPFPINGAWRKTEGSLFSAVRANAPHNWAYFKSIEPRLVFLKEAFKIKGTGIGDFHILNIADIELAKGSRKIGLVDVDDGGHTSLFADFTRAAISNQVSPYKVPLRDFWNEYLSGLANNKAKKPKIIEEILESSHKDFLDQQKSYLKTLVEGDAFSPKAGVRALPTADPVTQDIYLKSLSEFRKVLGSGKILDQGYKIKETGGSQGIPRFWFLVEKNGDKSIIEFKTLAEPAMALFEKQSSQKDRINDLIEKYRPQKTNYGLYQFVDSGPYQFIARERLKFFLNLDPEGTVSNKEAQNGQSVYLYLAHRAGTWHLEQGQGEALHKALTQQEEQSYREFEKLVKNYIAFMQKENRL